MPKASSRYGERGEREHVGDPFYESPGYAHGVPCIHCKVPDFPLTRTYHIDCALCNTPMTADKWTLWVTVCYIEEEFS